MHPLQPYLLKGSRTLPVFAMEGYALLPATVMALQVLEPAICEMVGDCQATDRLLVVCGRDGTTGALRSVAGLGKLVSVRGLDDGSREVYLHGLGRVRVLRLVRERPYRMAEVEPLSDVTTWRERREMHATLRRLHAFVDGLLRAGELQPEVARIIAGAGEPAVLTYRLGAVLMGDPALKQRLLEERSPLARMDLLIERIGTLLMAPNVKALAADELAMPPQDISYIN